MNLPEIDEPVRYVDGSRNLLIRNRLFHSRIDPEKELDRFIQARLQNLPEKSSVLLIGAGALFEKLLPVANRLTLFLYEPLSELRARYRSLSPPIRLIEPDTPDLPRNANIVILPVYLRLFPELVRQMEDLIRLEDRRPGSISSQKKDTGTAAPTDIDEKTHRHFLRLWMRNYRQRLDHESLPYFETIDPLPDTLLFCGAGPNLAGELRTLKERYSGSANPPGWFVVAADTSAAAVLAEGWRIDMILSVDSGPGTSYHLGLIHPALREACPVLTWLPGSLFLEKGGFRPLFVPTLFPPDQILASTPGMPAPWTNPLRNVAGYAFALRQHCEIPRIWLAGCGFQTSHGTYYTRGTGYGLYQNLRSSRLCIMDDQDLRLTLRMSDGNRKTAGLLEKSVQDSSHTSLSVPDSSSTPSATQFRILSRSFSGDQLRSALALENLPGILGKEFGPEWARMARRHLDFRD